MKQGDSIKGGVGWERQGAPAKGVDGGDAIVGSVVSRTGTEGAGGAEILRVGWSRGGFFGEAFFLAHALVGLGCAVV
jgi:hypothetical protein